MVTYSMQMWDKHLSVTGPVPICDLKFISMLAAQHGFEVMDLFLARHYGVSLYITTREFADQTIETIYAGSSPESKYLRLALTQGEDAKDAEINPR